MAFPDLPTSTATGISPKHALDPLVRSTFTTSSLSFHLNGRPIVLSSPDPDSTLLTFIRSQRGLKGTKLGCGEGGCGACTVVVQQISPSTARVESLAINACLAPLVSVDGKHVITVEGLGTADNPHPLQERMAKMHASQCGFCTPGIVMSLYAMLRNSAGKLTHEMLEFEGVLDGNLCRCTGYRPILEAAKTFVKEDLGGVVEDGEWEGDRLEGGVERIKDHGKSMSCGRPGGCCRDSPGKSCSSSSSEEDSASGNDTDVTTPLPVSGAEYGAPLKSDDNTDNTSLQISGKPKATTESLACEKGASSIPQYDFKPYTPNTEIIFPSVLRKYEMKPLCFANGKRAWFRPTTLDQVLRLKEAFPSCKLVAGNNEVQVEIKFKNSQFAVAVYVGDVPELKGFEYDEERQTVRIGGNTSLTVVEKECITWASKLSRRAMVLEALMKQLRYFAGRQIRNSATMAGNLATASPISDLSPVLVCCGAEIVVESRTKKQRIPIRDFFIAYRTTSLPADAVITSILIPLGDGDGRQVTKSYKQARRKDDDIAIVTAGLMVHLGEDDRVRDVCLAFGGMGPTTLEAKHTQLYLMGKQWFDPSVLEGVMGTLEEDFNLSFMVPGGMATYRKTLAFNFFLRFWNEVAQELGIGTVDPDLTAELDRHQLLTGSRDHENPFEQRVVGKQIPHLSGLKHTTGEAQYVDDIPRCEGELYGALVLSSRAHARLVEVDFSPAMELPGVDGYVDYRDLPEDRSYWGSVNKDERFFAKDEVLSHGQPIGLVYADSQANARAAAKVVRIVYEDRPVIITIDEAIAADSMFKHGKMLKRGNSIDLALSECDHVFEGVSRMGGQEHFYLETNASLVIPHVEDGQMEVWSSTQNTMETQEFVSQVTGVPSNRIIARVKRMGGAFGGKESRSVQLAAILAVAAKKSGRPIRCMLNRDEDMMTTGQRHPFMAKWRVGVSKQGMLQALDADVYNNAGFSQDLSGAVMDRCLTHIDNSYWIPNVHVRGHVCRTNTHSNTAFRGFGGPQGMYITECIMTTIADKLDLDVDELRVKNLYKEGQLTPFLQPLINWHVPALLSTLKSSCSFAARKSEIETFNRTHKYKKRGISLLPTKFGISFATALHLNQAGCLIHIYHDGSILLSHGGTEMGQGLYTKMIQLTAELLQVPLDAIHTSDSSSATVANPSPTAASSGSDLNGMAIQNACEILNTRLAPYRAKFGTDMSVIAHAAYRDRINLSANGFYKTPGIGFTWGNYVDPLPMYSYFTQGAACSEVEVDVLTGDHIVRRTDIIMDIGRSINPAIDYGQIEGAFVQGSGLFTIEETLWNKDGSLATSGPGSYKIPTLADVPKVLNVQLMKPPNAPTATIQSSKGVGEPPLFLAATVLFAIREAVKAARPREETELVLHSPATCERIREAIGGDAWERYRVPRGPGEVGWFLVAQGGGGG